MISGAIHQSGTALFDGTNQYSHHVNEYIADLGRLLLPGIDLAEPDLVVDHLRPIAAADVLYGDFLLDNSGRKNNPRWLPVKHDRAFYTEDAKNKLLRGQICKNISYMMGTNSFEGNLLWVSHLTFHWAWDNISFVFDLLKGFEEDTVTLDWRFIEIPEEERDQIIQGFGGDFP